MDFITKLVEWAHIEMAVPPSYGWFHLVSVGITILSSILVCIFFRGANDRTVRKICFIFWITILLFEIYKQFVFGTSVEDGRVVVDYAWYIFPFQLCSTPLYILPLVIFLKDGWLRDAATAFMIAFSIFGGICVYIFPGDVFTEFIGINIQTMVHHGIQIVSGVYLAAKYREKLRIGYYLRGAAVFGVLLAFAIALNELVYLGLVAGGQDDKFNMFYISRHFDCTLPVLSAIYPNVPYPVFVAIYTVGFIVAAAIIFYAAKGITLLCNRIGKRTLKNAD